MELINRDKRDGYLYDPIVKAYDTTFWKTITGTPAMSTIYLRFTSATAASFLQHIYADFEVLLNVPVKPTAGDARYWGFRNQATDALGAAYFDISGTAFTAKVVGDDGTVTSTTLTWNDAAWSAHAIPFRIRWEAQDVNFYINGSLVASISAGTNKIPNNALEVSIKNGVADNMDMTYMAIRRAASIV